MLTPKRKETPSQKIAKKMIARFPITHPPVPDQNVGGGAYDVGCPYFKLSLNKNAPADDQIGKMDASVYLHTSARVVGFDGCCLYRFLDEKGNNIWAILGDQHGVAPTSDPTYPSELTKDESHYIPLDVLTEVYSVEIEPRRVTPDTVENLRKTVEQISKGAEVVRDGLKKIGATAAEIGAAIKASS